MMEVLLFLFFSFYYYYYLFSLSLFFTPFLTSTLHMIPISLTPSYPTSPFPPISIFLTDQL